MGKFISPFVIAFLFGLSSAGFFSVWQVSSKHEKAVEDAKRFGLKPDTTAKHDSTGADSTKHAGDHAAEPAAHDSAAGAHDAGAKPGADTAHVAEKPAEATTGKAAAEAAKPAAATPPAATPPANAAPDAETAAHQRRLAKIFSTMGAKDAARVLGQMSDGDVSVILGLLGDRQAAAILTSMPAPRAATLSQMQPRRGGGGE